ncbi:MAG: RusA family crossover junction endodeoxyribonuclease [Mycobacterium sp.]|nr:RusA family crossover junction endodeoxyribonuclease [Mycobacterium sp.]
MLIRVFGDPVPKGSMKCVGRRGRAMHSLIDNKQDRLDIWMPKIRAGAEAARDKLGGTLHGPITICLTITVPRPASVTLAARPWPITRSSGDIDKHERSILDALTYAQLIDDDSQVVHVDKWQCYPDTPGVPDRMDRPGATIRIETLT